MRPALGWHALLACVPLQTGAPSAPEPRAELPLLLDDARDVSGEGIAFVAIEPSHERCWLHEPVRVTLRFGIEEEFLRTRSVQPFGVRLDVPVQVVAPWTGGLAGAAAIGPATPAAGDGGASAASARATFALNEGVARAARVADVVEGDRRYHAWAVTAELSPASVGELRLVAPKLVLAYATEFRESLLAERTPLDRVDAFVAGEPASIEVLALPEEGRPWEFAGAVGSFTVRAALPSRELVAGESVDLEITVEGRGNLFAFEPPAWELAGFRVLGSTEEERGGARVFTLDVAPLDEAVRALPSIALAYWDPAPPPGYRVARTEPVDVVVRARSGTSAPGTAPRAKPRRGASSDDRGSSGALVVVGGVVLAAAALIAAARRRA